MDAVMTHLILSQPSEDYAKAVSHELWMLARPRGVSDSETSQFYCGVQKHTDGRVSIGPLDGTQPIHADADELSFGALIGHAVTDAEELMIIETINGAKGGQIMIVDLIESLPSLSPNLRTYKQLDADGWFTTE